MPLTEEVIEEAAGDHDLSLDDVAVLYQAMSPDEYLEPEQVGAAEAAHSIRRRVRILERRQRAGQCLYNIGDMIQGMDERLVRHVTTKTSGNGSKTYGRIDCEHAAADDVDEREVIEEILADRCALHRDRRADENVCCA